MRALLSVYDKTGIVEFAQQLHDLGVELVSSGGTAAKIAEAGIPVTDVAEFTGYPAMLGHRVVTLHPLVHGAILADPSDESHQADIEQYGIRPFDIVVVNLYPFMSDPSIDLIDIGGPAMVRAAAKNFKRVAVVTDPVDYEHVLRAIQEAQGAGVHSLGSMFFGASLLRKLARKAFAHTAAYDAEIVRWLDAENARLEEWAGVEPSVPETLHITAHLIRELSKGENGHQKPAAMYEVASSDPLATSRFQLIEGNPGWVNLTDHHRSLVTLTQMAAGIECNTGTDSRMLYALAVKHGNASGASFGRDPIEVLQRTLYGNLISIHGGWLVVNFQIGAAEAECLRTHAIQDPQFKRILAGVVAPDISEEARQILHRKNDLCAMLVNPALAEINWESRDQSPHIRQIWDGYMVQPRPMFVPDFSSGGGIQADFPLHMMDIPNLALAWAIGSTTVSNTITITGGQRLLGLGCGQMDRVGAAKLALERLYEANDALRALDLPLGELVGACAHSDSFFPFPDGLLALADAGIRTVMATSGSVNDAEVRAAAVEREVNLVTLPDAVARGFSGH